MNADRRRWSDLRNPRHLRPILLLSYFPFSEE